MTISTVPITGHAKLGPSKRNIWRRCAAAPRLIALAPPRPSSPWAEEGTRAHAVAEAALLYALGVSNERPVSDDAEMLAAAQVWARIITDARCKHTTNGPRPEVRVEVYVSMRSIHEDAGGTADALIYCPICRVLTVADFKYGKGHAVDVLDNEQIEMYAAGFALECGLPISEVRAIVHQPRRPYGDTIQRATFDGLRLAEIAATIRKEARATDDPNAQPVPGDHCRWCDAKPICPALRAAKTAAAARAFEGAAVPAMDLGAELELAERVEIWAIGIREHAYAEAEAGRPPAGWKLVPKRPTRSWLLPKDADGQPDHEAILRALDGADGGGLELDPSELYDPPTLKSPAQLEAYLTDEAAAALAPLVVKGEGKGARRKWARADLTADDVLAALDTENVMHALRAGDLLNPATLKSPAAVEEILGNCDRLAIAPLIVSVSSGTTLVRDTDKRSAVTTPAERAAIAFQSTPITR